MPRLLATPLLPPPPPACSIGWSGVRAGLVTVRKALLFVLWCNLLLVGVLGFVIA